MKIDFERIDIQWLKQPDTGGVIFVTCDRCKTLNIMYSEHSIKPKDGNAWHFNNMCPDIQCMLDSRGRPVWTTQEEHDAIFYGVYYL